VIDRQLRALGLQPRPPPLGRLGAVAPVPFVGLATILVALIVFTPVLIASGPSPLAVEGYLYVYRGTGSTLTDFEVAAYDQEVPYDWLNLSVGTGFAWDGRCPTSALNWTYLNETDALVANRLTGANPVVVNATAVYVQGGSRTVYAGELAFDLVGQNSSSESLVYAPCPWTPGVSSPGSWSVTLGTDPFPLVNYGSGGPP